LRAYKIDSQMEKAIIEAYLKTVQEHTRKYVETVEAESKAFAAALSGIKGIGIDPSLESRIRTLEARASADHRFHTTLNGLSEDIGDLNERLIRLERSRVNSDMDNIDSLVNPWSSDATEDQFVFDSLQNEVVVDDKTTVVDLSPYIPNPIIVHKKDEEKEKGKEKGKKEVEVVEAKVVGEEATEEAEVEQEEEVEEAEEAQEEEQAEEQEEEQEEEDSLNVEPFEYNGRTYYKDEENNVYQEDEEGGVDDTPIGRYLEAKKKIKFYPTSA